MWKGGQQHDENVIEMSWDDLLMEMKTRVELTPPPPPYYQLVGDLI